jgi:hypothetical protein
LCFCWRHLGVPFIVLRGLEVVGIPFRKQSSPSIGWRTGQSVSGARSPSFSGEADCWAFGPLSAPDTVRCTPDSPVRPSDRWLGHVSLVDHAVDRWRRASLAHRTVRCTPDSPVNFSRGAPANSREQLVCCSTSLLTGHCPVRHRTVRCTTD